MKLNLLVVSLAGAALFAGAAFAQPTSAPPAPPAYGPPITLAQKKAETAASFKRPSQVFQDHVQANVYILQLGGTAIGGGVPIMSDGKVIGAIGVSGSPGSAQDEKVAQAGVEALEKK